MDNFTLTRSLTAVMALTANTSLKENSSFTNNTSLPAKLQMWNQYYVDKFLPASIFLMTLLIFGVLGNVLVVRVYMLCPALRTTGRFFIPYLAVSDISSTVFGVSLGLIKFYRHVTSPSDAICKILSYLTNTSVFTSSFLLLSIAIQRYIMICRPFGRQISKLEYRVFLLLSVSMPGVFLTPLTVWSGTFHITNNELGVEGTKCGYIQNYMDRASAYWILVAGIPILEICIMTFIYYRIWKYIPKTDLKKKTYYSDPKQVNECTTDITNTVVLRSQHSIEETEVAEDQRIYDEKNTVKPGQKTLEDDGIEGGSMCHGQNHQEECAPKIDSKSKKTEIYSNSNEENDNFAAGLGGDTQASRFGNQKACRFHTCGGKFSRTTTIFIIISVIAFLTYGPSTLMVAIEIKDHEIYDNFSPPMFIFCSILRVFYLFNHSANPLIYGIFDTKFRSELTLLIFAQNSN